MWVNPTFSQSEATGRLVSKLNTYDYVPGLATSFHASKVHTICQATVSLQAQHDKNMPLQGALGSRKKHKCNLCVCFICMHL